MLKDLVRLKAFLLSGTTITIVEEKVGGWNSPGVVFDFSAPLLLCSALLSGICSPAPLLAGSRCLSRKILASSNPASVP